MNCCGKCFRDKVLIKQICATGTRGLCDFCKARSNRVVPAASLAELFSPLLELFEPVEYGTHLQRDFGPEAIDIGEMLPNCLEWENGWSIFALQLQEAEKCRLLDGIRAGSHEIGDPPSSDLWVAKTNTHTLEQSIWHDFAETIKWKRRFIPEAKAGFMSAPKDWLPQYLHEISNFVEPSSIFYRARLGEEAHSPYRAADMGTPPRIRATAGRANPRGIPYLYVAEKAMTAVCEIRPFLGGRVTIAEVRPRVRLQLVDLTKVPDIKSPFGRASLADEMEKKALLSVLNRELSKPVNPALAEIQYIPTQYLAEIILDAGYDGIRYKSAMHKGGRNVVFFDQDKLKIDVKTKLVRITATALSYKPET